MTEAEPSTRLYVLLARESPRAVVFRRGPSGQVALVGWDTERHAFGLGQWFRGRIYERRCDLSPSGERLIYFAGTHRGPYGTWTAVSRPPYLTALVLWPKGDAWGGGGLFADERTIELNHPPNQETTADGLRPPGGVRVRPFGTRPGGGEDEPIWSARMRRDGWVLRSEGVAIQNPFDAPIWWEFDPPRVWARPHRHGELQLRLTGIRERGGTWYVQEHRVVDRGGAVVVDLGRSDWADWSRSGELLFARDGRLHRIRMAHGTELEELVDLRGLRFTELPPAPGALEWSGPGDPGRPIDLAGR